MHDEGLETVHLRTEFYRDSYKRIISALLLAVFIIFILSGALIYILLDPPKPKYFATTINGRIMPLVPLAMPNIAPSALLQWANTAAIAAYSYNFVNYREELQAAAEFFTPEGWSAFLSALQDSRNLDAVIEKKLVVSAVATGAPVILQEGVLRGSYAWRVQMPMLITYQSASSYLRQSVIVTMLITRVSTLVNTRGLGIAQFIVDTTANVNS